MAHHYHSYNRRGQNRRHSPLSQRRHKLLGADIARALTMILYPNWPERNHIAPVFVSHEEVLNNLAWIASLDKWGNSTSPSPRTLNSLKNDLRRQLTKALLRAGIREFEQQQREDDDGEVQDHLQPLPNHVATTYFLRRLYRGKDISRYIRLKKRTVKLALPSRNRQITIRDRQNNIVDQFDSGPGIGWMFYVPGQVTCLVNMTAKRLAAITEGCEVTTVGAIEAAKALPQLPLRDDFDTANVEVEIVRDTLPRPL